MSAWGRQTRLTQTTGSRAASNMHEFFRALSFAEPVVVDHQRCTGLDAFAKRRGLRDATRRTLLNRRKIKG